jgi:hypothetical protein
MVMLCKSCRYSHKETRKIGFAFYHFLLFSMNFTRFNTFTLDLEETVLRISPRISQIGPPDEKLDCNWVPGAMAGGGILIPVRARLGSTEKGQRRHE